MNDQNTSLRILGIDPGLNITGYGVLECGCATGSASASGRNMSATGSASATGATTMHSMVPGLSSSANGQLRLCEAGVVRGKSRRSLTDRLVEIHAGVADVIASLNPSVMAIEELYSHYNRPRTAILMGHARGVICLAAAEAGIPVIHYSATQIKKILTGAGRASKSQVQRAIQRELALTEVPDPPDVADALAVALCHYYLKDKLSIMRR
jgi:crossover junction endodeoxyribonuclease RuvC